MTWWCSAIAEPWSWKFRFYPGIWLMMALIVGSYVWATVRHRRTHGPQPGDRRKQVWFALGAIVLWVATDWPVGTLGASYLASVHMAQYMLYTLVAAPLLVLGIPEWMARAAVERLHLQGVARTLTRPIVAAVAFNLILIATHAPWTVDTFRASEVGSMLLDLAWLGSGLILWQPLISPMRELRHPSPAVRCVYLFLAAGAMPMIPGGFLTFSEFPLYSTYEVAQRVHGISAQSDQQAAGVLMKVGNIPIVWTVIFVIFARWALTERDAATRPDKVVSGRSRTARARTSTVAAPAPGPAPVGPATPVAPAPESGPAPA